MRTGVDNDDNLKRFGNYLTFWKNTKMSDKFLLFFFDPKNRHHRHRWMGYQNGCPQIQLRCKQLLSNNQSKIIAVFTAYNSHSTLSSSLMRYFSSISSFALYNLINLTPCERVTKSLPRCLVISRRIVRTDRLLGMSPL